MNVFRIHSMITPKTLVYVFGSVFVWMLAILYVFGGSGQALSGNQFTAGRIIDDTVFFNHTTMNPDQIQAFLNSKVPVCDTNGTQPYAGTTRAAYGASRGHPAPYTCLKDYTETIPTIIHSGSDLCTQSIAGGTKSAAQIIYDVAQACRINPQALLVLLQKEQGLVTDDWPWSTQYRSATGYGCPDTAPCDSQYYGFFNQVYQAGKAYRRYEANPTSYSYRAGRNNFVQYHPNSACGGSTFFIENQATTNLYIYTPYQPNQAALDNLYGTGDGCSAYGNRNFWRMFNDWFGTTFSSHFLRSVENATVYLVSDDEKFPVSDGRLIDALYQFGGVSFIGQSYLDTKATGQTLTRLIRAPDGTVYFFDAGIKLPFSSCATIAHYGLSCSHLANLTQPQIDLITTGPSMTRYFGTTNGKSFYIENSKRREVLDTQSLSENGLGGAVFNVLNESAIDYLGYGVPVVRDGVIVGSRNNNTRCLYLDSVCHTVSWTVYTQTPLSNVFAGSVDKLGYDQLSPTTALSGFIRDASSNHYVLDAQGKAPISTPADWGVTFTQLDSNFINNTFPTSSQPVNNMLVKGKNNGTVYFIEGQKKRVINNWNDLTKLNVSPFTINVVSDKTVQSIPTGTSVIAPGSLVKYGNSSTVYFVDGVNKKIPVSTFLVPIQMGVNTSVTTASNARLDYYTTDPSALPIQVSCGGKNYVANTWALYEVEASSLAHYNFTYQNLDDRTCSNLAKSTNTLGRYVRVPGGTIYYIESGAKRAFGSWGAYVLHGGTSANTRQISQFVANAIPNGAPL